MKARFWTLVAARPQLKSYLADQFEGSDLDADWEAVQGLLTAEILAGAWHTTKMAVTSGSCFVFQIVF